MKSRAMATMGAGVDSARVVGDASNPSSSSTATYRSARASTSRSSARSASANARASSSGSSAGGDGRAATALRWARALAAASALWAGVSVAKYVRENGVPDISPQRVHEAIDSAGVLGVVVYVAGVRVGGVVAPARAGVHNRRNTQMGEIDGVDLIARHGAAVVRV